MCHSVFSIFFYCYKSLVIFKIFKLYFWTDRYLSQDILFTRHLKYYFIFRYVFQIESMYTILFIFVMLLDKTLPSSYLNTLSICKIFYIYFKNTLTQFFIIINPTIFRNVLWAWQRHNYKKIPK